MVKALLHLRVSLEVGLPLLLLLLPVLLMLLVVPLLLVVAFVVLVVVVLLLLLLLLVVVVCQLCGTWHPSCCPSLRLYWSTHAR
jgi:hypothetical protein